MALVLGLTQGDVVDIADHWIEVLSVRARKTATIVTNVGEKVEISAGYATEILPTVWVQVGLGSSKQLLRLLFVAPKSLRISRRSGK